MQCTVCLMFALMCSPVLAQEMMTNKFRNDTVNQRDSLEIMNAKAERLADSLSRIKGLRRRHHQNPFLGVHLMPGSKECLVRFKLEAIDTVTIFITDKKGNRKKFYKAVLSAGEQNIRLSIIELVGGVYNVTVKTSTKELHETLMFVRREPE